MQKSLAIGLAAIVLQLSGCGSSEPEPEQPPMKVEDTVFGDLVGTQDKARDRSNAAMDTHREALEAQIEADQAAPPEE